MAGLDVDEEGTMGASGAIMGQSLSMRMGRGSQNLNTVR